MLDQLLTSVRAGRSQVLVVRGEAGVGKSALLEHLVRSASGFRVARAAGHEYEMELAYAGLHPLCAPLLDLRERLPGPQRDAVAAAFGLSAAPAPDRFVVGLGVLGLLSAVAEERPLLWVVDDAQWLDKTSALTLAFVARRLLAEPVGLVFAVREPSNLAEVTGLPELVVGGLGDDDARALLDSALPGRLDELVRDRIVAESGGNPLALLELPRGLTPAELAGGFGVLDATPLANRIEQSFLRRLDSLPDDTRRLLLTAAAEPVGDVALLWRAAARLGLGADAAAPAQSAGLVDLRGRVRFRHPLVRSAIYGTATLPERERVHHALAEATDPDVDPDRRAWHRAHATTMPDEDIATELELSAGRAARRGGLAAAAAFLERAAELTPDPARRGRRALAAARAKVDSGAPDAADKLLAVAEMCPLDDLQRARLARLRAQIAFALRRGSDSPPLLLDAADRLAPLDGDAAREAYLEALGAAIFAGRLNDRVGPAEVATAARDAPRARQPPRPIDLLLDGLTTRYTDGYVAGVAPLRRALTAFGPDAGGDHDELMRWFWLPWLVAGDLWDDETWYGLATRAVRLCRDAGALVVLPLALGYRAVVHLHAGEFEPAASLVDESDAITEATGNAPAKYASLLLAVWRGVETESLAALNWGLGNATARGEGRGIGGYGYTSAVLYNGLGRYGDALAGARSACEYDDLGILGFALVELIEAAARSGAHEEAAAALRRLEERTGAAGTDWALGVQARSTALLSDGAAAESCYREAIDRLAHSRIAVHLARAHLVYGEWLRRENRRVDAREQLRTAHDMFTRTRAEAFAERARRELLATGGTARRRTVDTRDALTPQEGQIARLAREGLSNPEIGAQLFISPRTVQYHLGKVFAKLEITSRGQLNRLPLSGLDPT
ncbi:putative transcriptional regulator, LuxR family protein [Virgisporangium aurantiacum]|uniref:Putative transcriptional regulator, LuxR family protein n=1 Tax=Virgisporangium aurantiacum TaxID=175570 RepID=A0A8J4DXB2_9ACTN|nr:putative transcriptional regulator, LuxR family protein [Virgisporangium aurantiacum]